MWRTINPIAVGRRVFTPSRPDRVQDPAVKKVQVVRTVVGFAAVVCILLAYRLVTDAEGLLDQRMDQVETSVNLLAITFPVCVAGFIAATRPPSRQLFLRRALKPLGALCALFCSIVFVLLLGNGVFGDVLISSKATPSPGAYARLAFTLFFLLWVVPFILYGIAMVLIHVFRTADIHEALPPLLAMVLVWELAVSDLFTGAYDAAPFGVRMALIFGAPLSITALSLWELRRLRSRHGITVRQAMLR
ncbi:MULTISPECIES: hypothetical protein [unclassified Streptomyces]|uniref:hypothetical protein n=1 Tax=unclassified Streptomyces TaxID=2593676 RepID=UPI002DD9F76F|nr:MULTISPECIES: hypothetical protein [unclassified Streptomyces]WSA96593.1 hypothetical protein OIE63_37345 [Streptomyces sp. NBC_01795]WSB81008.1 hypothetical protein OHB04_38465 [Streptomyces sp. NBC_01775]WSS10781.1 hypothetical protein OG533_01790 [Streptomyces sp. NBC_01186]WSS39481.1 hypothetical protein OG220_01835 [Streptomyces sp. NBC_01187]